MTPAGRRRAVAAAAAAATLLVLAVLGGAGAGQDVDLSAVPSAPDYLTRVPQGPGFLGAEGEALGRSLPQINAALGASLRPDPRLARLAQWVRGRLGPGSSLPGHTVIDALTRRLGLAEPQPHFVVTGAPDARQLASIISSRLAGIIDVENYTHIGGLAEREAGAVVVVIALSRRDLELRPVPRRLDAPGRIVIEGRLKGAFDRPELARTLPGGRTVVEPLGPGPGFRRSVRLATAGVHRLEILAHGRGGPAVIANIPIFVAVPADTAAAPAPLRRPGLPQEPRARLLALVNADRAAAGLEPLVPDAALDEVAARHSEDMRANGFVAHVSPTSGTTKDRLARAGIMTDLAPENVGKAYDAEEIHGGFMDSPGHRAAILNADATHIGLGLASAVENGRTTYFVTELFVRRIAALGPDARRVFRRELDRLRRILGLSPLIEDPDLAGIAGALARAYLNDPGMTQDEALEGLRSRIRRDLPNAGRIYSVFSVVGSLEAGAKQAAADPRAEKARRVGIGIAQGARPGLVPNAIVLVLLYADGDR